jgi:hypothetical protein
MLTPAFSALRATPIGNESWLGMANPGAEKAARMRIVQHDNKNFQRRLSDETIQALSLPLF